MTHAPVNILAEGEGSGRDTGDSNAHVNILSEGGGRRANVGK